MHGLKKYLYNYLFFPIMVVLAHLIAPFHKELRKGLKGRYLSAKELKKFKQNGRPVAFFHAASLGEFEHIRPLIFYLGQTYRIVVTFFSPSGYDHAKKQFPDEEHFYLPFDFYGLWLQIFAALQPKYVFISKHDIWANQIMAAKKSGIPVFLVNASLSAKSSRLNFWYRAFYGGIYKEFNGIFAISEEDGSRFEKTFNLQNVRVVGDTKFDQVMIRKEQARSKHLLPKEWLQKNPLIALGSIWPEDYAVLRGPLKQLMREYASIKLLFVPHQPHEAFLKIIETDFGAFGCQRYSEKNLSLAGRCLLVDVVGVLADLYKYAEIAYVGGSFKQGIHNVMEPAVYGIPVIFGPKHENSYEATKLVKDSAAFVVRQEQDVMQILKRLIVDATFRKNSGNKVLNFVDRHTGATKSILAELGMPYE